MAVKKAVKKPATPVQSAAPAEHTPAFPARFISPLADEIAKTVVQRLPSMLPRPRSKTPNKKSTAKQFEHALFFDTSAIIDGRVFDVIDLGLVSGIVVVPETILLELKHIADSQDMVKRERGRKGLERLEKLKKTKGIKVIIMPEEKNAKETKKKIEVDEKLIAYAKKYKGRVVTCDYNLEKKASIQGVIAVNINELANRLKVQAVPGESLHIHIQHAGKDPTQGVGYLDDGTMVVVEKGASYLEQNIDVVIARVIATSSGRIFFSKKI